MNITQLEKEIIKALKINSNVDWLTVDPNQEFKDLNIDYHTCLFKLNKVLASKLSLLN